MTDLGPALQIVAEAAQLKAELEEALPHLPAAMQVPARTLINQLDLTLKTLSFCCAVAVQEEESHG